jgi:nitrate reductase gamma subunit
LTLDKVGVFVDSGSWVLIVVAYVSILIFTAGMIMQVLKWWMAAVPFPLTLFPASPGNGSAFGRMLVDTLFFRSLWRRNMEVWVSGWGFHLLLTLLILGHIAGISAAGHQFVAFGASPERSTFLSEMLGMGIGIGLLAALLYLLGRRIVFPRIRAISGKEDYAVLGLLLLIALSGMMMRLGAGGMDLAGVRGFTAGLITLRPVAAPEALWFRIHFLLVCSLLIWFPFSKLVHSCGVFMSRWLITRTYLRQVVVGDD